MCICVRMFNILKHITAQHFCHPNIPTNAYFQNIKQNKFHSNNESLISDNALKLANEHILLSTHGVILLNIVYKCAMCSKDVNYRVINNSLQPFQSISINPITV